MIVIILFRKLLRIHHDQPTDTQLHDRADAVKAKSQSALRASDAALQQVRAVEATARRPH